MALLEKSIFTLPNQFDIGELLIVSKKLDDLGVLRCDKCRKVFRIPILISENGLNACQRCIDISKDEFQDVVFVRNFLLEKLIQRLYVPCSFVEKGCCETSIQYQELENHEAECTFRFYLCPTKGETSCTWSGSIKDISKHVNIEHALFVEDSSTATFKFEAKDLQNKCTDLLKMTVDVVKLLRFSSDYFIFSGNFNAETKILSCKVCQIKTNTISKSVYKYQTTIFNDTGIIGAPIFDIYGYSYSHDLDNLLKLDLNVNSSLFVRITISKMDYIDKNDKLLQEFECANCQKYMVSEIYQYTTSHFVCDICIEKLTECYPFRAVFKKSEIRNSALESLANGLYFPCKNKDLGCEVILRKRDLLDHQSVCRFNDCKCPFSRCSLVLPYYQLADHLKIYHADLVVLRNFAIVDLSLLMEGSNSTICMIAFGCIFKITYSNHRWVATKYFSTNDAKMCSYEFNQPKFFVRKAEYSALWLLRKN